MSRMRADSLLLENPWGRTLRWTQHKWAVMSAWAWYAKPRAASSACLGRRAKRATSSPGPSPRRFSKWRLGSSRCVSRDSRLVDCDSFFFCSRSEEIKPFNVLKADMICHVWQLLTFVIYKAVMAYGLSYIALTQYRDFTVLLFKLLDLVKCLVEFLFSYGR